MIKLHDSKDVLALITLLLFAMVLFSYGCDSYNNDYNSSTGPQNTGNPGPNEVWMQNIAYNPSTLTVDAGTTVTWTNKDNVIHTVTSGTPGNADGLFNSGNLSKDQTFSFTFDSTGTYNYYCIPHSPNMKGKVIVE